MKTINTARIIEALRNVDADIPTATFCDALAERINPKPYAQGIALAVALFCHDLARGRSGLSGKPLPAALLGYPGMVYGLMRDEAVRIIAINADADDFDDMAAVFGLSDDPIIRSLNKAKLVPLTDRERALLAEMGPSRET